MKDIEKLTERTQIDLGAEGSIVINKDRLFELVKILKEIRKLIPTDTLRDYTSRHDIKQTYLILNNILEKNGIDFYLGGSKEKKRLLEFQHKIKAEALEENK